MCNRTSPTLPTPLQHHLSLQEQERGRQRSIVSDYKYKRKVIGIVHVQQDVTHPTDPTAASSESASRRERSLAQHHQCVHVQEDVTHPTHPTAASPESQVEEKGRYRSIIYGYKYKRKVIGVVHVQQDVTHPTHPTAASSESASRRERSLA